ncbi:MAG: DegT/DnrJ/EryC1/StrS family aminotransferase [Planctomycetota bacterium]|nr:MAG: DegT/DnrJ/EryC1/StrS family aminotransferase [Planctomycetota bacterium]
MEEIVLVDLRAQYQDLKEEIDKELQEVFATASFIGGPRVEAFEEEFARFCGLAACAGVSSGTDALALGLSALEMPPDAKVLVPANTFIATASAVCQAGGQPVFVDVEENGFLIDLADAERKAKNAWAILAVDLYGQGVDGKRLLDFAQSYNLLFLEDAAQAHGAKVHNQPVGHYAKWAAFSFYPGKNLGAAGDAGALCSNDPEVVQRVKLLRNHGCPTKYHSEILGGNFRLDSLQAGILRIKLKYLEQWNQKRRFLASLYHQYLQDCPKLQLPTTLPGREHVFHLYVVRTPVRDKLLQFLHSQKIFAGLHYPVALPLQKCFAYLGHKEGDFPVAERLAKEILSLPLHPYLSEKQVEYISDKITSFLKSA